MAVQDYADLIRQNAQRYGLDPALLEAKIQAESAGQPGAVSPKGARGLGQVMPNTAQDPGYGVTAFDQTKPIDDPGENVRFTADYMSKMLTKYDGDIEHALAAYNWGPGHTDDWIKNGGKFDDLPEETRNHIDKVKAGHLSQTSGTAPDMSLTGLEDKVSTPTEELYKRTEAETAIRRASQSPQTPKGPEAPGGFFAKMGDEMEGLGKSLWASAYDVGSLLADMADFGFGDDDVTDKFAAYLQKQGEDVRETIPEWMKKSLEHDIISLDEDGEVQFDMPNLRQVAHLIAGSAIPSAGIVTGGFKLLKGVNKIKKLKKITEKYPKLTKAGSFGAANSAYVTAETYKSVYEEVLEDAREEGKSLKEAHESAAESASFAAGIIAPLAFVTGGAGEGLAASGKSFLTRLAKGFVGGGITEFPEEAGQSAVGELATGKPIDYVKAANQGFLGMMGGGVTEGAMAAAFGSAEAPAPKPKPTTDPIPEPDMPDAPTLVIAAGEEAGAADLPDIPDEPSSPPPSPPPPVEGELLGPELSPRDQRQKNIDEGVEQGAEVEYVDVEEGGFHDRRHVAELNGEVVGAIGYDVVNTGKTARISLTEELDPAIQRGKGAGVDLYTSFVDEQLAAGRTVESDNSVSTSAGRAYAALKLKGYEVTTNPKATFDEKTGWHVPGAPKGSVFSITKAPAQQELLKTRHQPKADGSLPNQQDILLGDVATPGKTRELGTTESDTTDMTLKSDVNLGVDPGTGFDQTQQTLPGMEVDTTPEPAPEPAPEPESPEQATFEELEADEEGLITLEMRDSKGNKIGGITYTVDHEAGVTQIDQTLDLDSDLKGRGFGVALYKKFIDEQLAAGRVVHSDAAVAPEARRVYEALERRGYNVITQPAVKGERGKAAYIVTRAPESPEVQAMNRIADKLERLIDQKPEQPDMFGGEPTVSFIPEEEQAMDGVDERTRTPHQPSMFTDKTGVPSAAGKRAAGRMSLTPKQQASQDAYEESVKQLDSEQAQKAKEEEEYRAKLDLTKPDDYDKPIGPKTKAQAEADTNAELRDAEKAQAFEDYLHGQVATQVAEDYWNPENRNGGSGGGGKGKKPRLFSRKWFAWKRQVLKARHWDEFVRQVQDAQIAIKRVQEVFKNAKGLVPDKVDLHGAWTRVPQEAVDMIRKMKATKLAPIINIAQGRTAEGVEVKGRKAMSNKDMQSFAAAVHSLFRNYWIAKKNGEMAPADNEVGGSGVSVKQAREIVTGLAETYDEQQLAELSNAIFNLSEFGRKKLAPASPGNIGGFGLIDTKEAERYAPDMAFKKTFDDMVEQKGFLEALKFENYSGIDQATWQENMHRITYVPLSDVDAQSSLVNLLDDMAWVRDDFDSSASIYGHELNQAYGRSAERGLASDSISQLIVNTDRAIKRGVQNHGLARRVVNQATSMADNRFAVVLEEAPNGTYSDSAAMQRRIKENWPAEASSYAFPAGTTPPVVRYKKGDTEVAVIIYDVRYADAIATTKTSQSHSKVVKAFANASGFVRRAMTTLNPGFLGVNVFREGINARIQTMSIPGVDRAALKEISKSVGIGNVASWSRDFFMDTRSPDEVADKYITGKDGKQKLNPRWIIRELKEAGMPSLLYEASDPTSVKEDLQKVMDEVASATSPKSAVKKMWSWYANGMEDLANATENGVRAMVAAGVYEHHMKGVDAVMAKLKARPEFDAMTDEQQMAKIIEKGQELHRAAINHAANAGKDLSVNFQRFGAKTRGMNKYWFFLNPTIQGTARISRTIAGKHGAMLMTRLGGYAAASTMVNYLIAGEDDDGRSLYEMNVPEWIREHHMVMMLPGTEGEYVSIPLPYGFNFFWGLGEATMSNLLTADTRNLTTAEAFSQMPGKMLSLAMNSFSPIPSTTLDSPVQSLAPSMFRPMVDLAVNKDWRGIPITPGQANYLQSKAPPPDAYNVRDPDPNGSLEWVTRKITQAANDLTGGNRFSPGALSVNPRTMAHLMKSYTGGVGMLAFRTADAVGLLAQGNPGEAARNLPLVRRFYGLGEGRYDDRDRYTKLRTELIQTDTERDGLRKNYSKDPDTYNAFMKTDGDLWSSGVMGKLKGTEKRIRTLSRLRSQLRRRSEKTKAQTDRIEALDDRITSMMVDFNKYYFDELVEGAF